jgi:putative transposase
MDDALRLSAVRAGRSFAATTDSRHNLPTYPNLARDMVPTAINQLWVADITYIRLRTEIVCVTALLDAFSRVQYACQRYTEMLKQHQALISMSRKGNPRDKPPVNPS